MHVVSFGIQSEVYLYIPISLPSRVLQNTKWPPSREPHKYAHLVNCMKATFHLFRGASSLANFSKLPHNPQIAPDSRALFFSAIPYIRSLRPHAFWPLVQRSFSLYSPFFPVPTPSLAEFPPFRPPVLFRQHKKISAVFPF